MAALRRLTLACWLGVLLNSAQGAWMVASIDREPGSGGGVEHVRVELQDPATNQDAEMHLALFPASATGLRVIDNPSGSSLAETMRRVKCVAGVNGGYFDPQNAPVGLVISDGTSLAPLRKARLLSGVLVASNGRVQLLRAAEYSRQRKATEALQCGPFLVDGGKPVAGLNDSRSARRTFVATAGADRAALGYCSAVTLADLGRILGAPGIVPGLKVQRALNLDGGSSSGFWFAGGERPFSIPEQKTVRNFVGVTGRGD